METVTARGGPLDGQRINCNPKRLPRFLRDKLGTYVLRKSADGLTYQWVHGWIQRTKTSKRKK